VITELWPNLTVVADDSPTASTVRFRVETRDHTAIIETSGHLSLDEIESWSDEMLLETLRALAGDRL
jgi:hypothetical protein